MYQKKHGRSLGPGHIEDMDPAEFKARYGLEPETNLPADARWSVAIRDEDKMPVVIAGSNEEARRIAVREGMQFTSVY